MKIKGQIILLLLMLVVCFNTDTYGAGKDTERGRPLSVDFKNDSVVIAAEFENDLRKVQAELAADAAIGLQIDGYGWNYGTPAKNREMAQKRAEAVQRWFVEHSVDPNRLVINNMGDSKPVARKDGAAAQTPAGRVEILQVSLNRPSAYLPADRYEFAPVMEGKEVVHDFVVQNKGSAPLEIQKVKTD